MPCKAKTISCYYVWCCYVDENKLAVFWIYNCFCNEWRLYYMSVVVVCLLFICCLFAVCADGVVATCNVANIQVI